MVWGKPRKNIIRVKNEYANCLNEIVLKIANNEVFPKARITHRSSQVSMGMIAKKTGAFIISKGRKEGTYLIPTRKIRKIDDGSKFSTFEFFD